MVSVMVIGAELTFSVAGAVAFDDGDGTLLDGDVVVEVSVVDGTVALLSRALVGKPELAPVERATVDVVLTRRPSVDNVTVWLAATVDGVVDGPVESTIE